VDYEIKDFVAVYKNAFSQEYCEDMIKNFEISLQSGYGITRQQENIDVHKTSLDDTAVFCGSSIVLNPNLYLNFNNTFWNNLYPKYSENFSILLDSGRHAIYENKLQKINIGQGYHIWHYESAKREISNRLLTYILYLNTVEEGGETEFLYYPRRIKPTQGTLVLWPASFTHTHRGNPPLSGTKYIMTGWVEF
jgi:hypothetical protein